MEWRLIRYEFAPTYTAGLLVDEADNIICDTLEPTDRYLTAKLPQLKVKGKTAIPVGRYRVLVTKSPKFKRWLPLLMHVPLFEGIRIHSGNTANDTAGCILVGIRADEKGLLVSSRQTELKLTTALEHEALHGDSNFITILRSYKRKNGTVVIPPREESASPAAPNT